MAHPTYDPRFIADVLGWLRTKAARLSAADLDALLQRANRLPGLHGRFVRHADHSLHFQPHTP